MRAAFFCWGYKISIINTTKHLQNIYITTSATSAKKRFLWSFVNFHTVIIAYCFHLNLSNFLNVWTLLWIRSVWKLPSKVLIVHYSLSYDQRLQSLNYQLLRIYSFINFKDQLNLSTFYFNLTFSSNERELSFTYERYSNYR